MDQVLATDRRLNADRRHDVGVSLSLRSWRSRRRLHRRGLGTDAPMARYVDWYEPKWLLAAAAVVMLSCVDAVTTLALLGQWDDDQGLRMAAVLRIDAALFVAFKLALAGAGLIMLIGQYRFDLFKWMPGARLLLGCLIAYGVLVAYELVYFFAG